MIKTLTMDAGTREMRLVYTDLWNGQHERTEYRVTSDRVGGHVVRNVPEMEAASATTFEGAQGAVYHSAARS